ncbi:hypothetical protein J6590_077465 [Homalodisca vitripennis]|nr:hypothetical protein J6590_077465 [Homalodisca vitripennis]
MRSRLTLLSAFGSAACAREYRSDNARSWRLMTLMGQNAHQEFGFVAVMPFPDVSTHKSTITAAAPRRRTISQLSGGYAVMAH